MEDEKSNLDIFKSKLDNELSKNYSVILSLFIIMIYHIETMEDGYSFLNLLIHSPLLDLHNDAKQVYKHILIKNNSKIITLEDILHIIKNKPDSFFKNINILFSNIFYTTCSKSELKNEWLFNYATDVFPIVKIMEEVYKERNKFISEVQLEEKFKNRIKLVRKVSVKRKIETLTNNDTSNCEKEGKKRKRQKTNDDINNLL